jgi:hypothetical protein
MGHVIDQADIPVEPEYCSLVKFTMARPKSKVLEVGPQIAATGSTTTMSIQTVSPVRTVADRSKAERPATWPGALSIRSN